MQSPNDAVWRQQILAQAEANKLYFENEKQLERARKDLLHNEYKNQQQERENKQRQKALERSLEQQQMLDKVEQYRGDQSSSAAQQRSIQMNLAKSYAEQISLNKLSNEEKKRRLQEEEAQRQEQVLRQQADDQMNKLKRKEQARQDMINFLGQKQQAAAKTNDNRYHASFSPQESVQQSTDDLSIQSIGNNQKYQQYMKQFKDKQEIAAKNFIPFDDKKGSRIDELVTRGQQQDQQRWLEEEQLKRNHLQSRRLDLKNGLQMQLAIKEKEQQQKKQDFLDNQSSIMQRSIDFQTQENSLKQKRMLDRQSYRDILDTQLAQREQERASSGRLSPSKQGGASTSASVMAGGDLTTDNTTQSNGQLRTPNTQTLSNSSSASVLGHNPLLNPLPNNLQNPYLLRQLLGSQASQASLNRMNYANLAQSSIVSPHYRKTQIY